jgi:hypothetical protein
MNRSSSRLAVLLMPPLLGLATMVQAQVTSDSLFVADNFDDNVLSSTWKAYALLTGPADTSVPVNEINRRLEIGPLSRGNSSSSYDGITTAGLFNFTGGYASVRLVHPSAAATEAYAMFAVGVNGNNFYRWYVLNGTTLVAQKKIGGTKTPLATFAYSPTAHQYLRIRHDSSSSMVVFETASSTGNGPTVWTSRYTETWNAAAVPLASVGFELEGGTTGVQSADPGTVAFDDFRAGVPTAETLLLVDDFAASTLDSSKWTKSVLSGLQDTSISVTPSSGLLDIGPLKQNTTSSHYNGVLSVSTLDLTGAYAAVQILAVPAAGDAMLTLPLDGSNHYRVYYEAGTVYFEKKLGGTKTIIGSVAYIASAHGFWRIRHATSNDNIVFETAPSVGGSPGRWTTQASVNREIAVTALKFEIKAGTSQAESTAPGIVQFDNPRFARPIGNIAPTTSLTAPANNATFQVSTPISLTATASDSDGAVSRVDFFVNAALTASDTTAPYSVTWTPSIVGSYTVTAKATDNLGGQTTSAPINISIVGANSPPSVNLTTPTNGASYTAGTPISVTATSTDPGGSVQSVKFYANSSLISTVVVSPYTVSWSPAAGNYSLTAMSTDNAGATTMSTPVSIAIAASCSYTVSPAADLISAPSASGTFTVTSPTGCSWQASSDSSWLTTSSTGSGGGGVSFSVAANFGSTSRTGTITVGGQSFTITQNANPAAPLHSPAVMVMPAAVANDPVVVPASFLDACMNMDQWTQVRGHVDFLGYADWAIDMITSAAQQQACFANLNAAGVSISLEVGALKPVPGCETAQGCYDKNFPIWRKIEDNGGHIGAFYIDEPLSSILDPDPKVSAFWGSLSGNFSYAQDQTRIFISLLRNNWPGVRIIEIEHFRQSWVGLLNSWIDGLACCGSQVPDYFEIDNDSNAPDGASLDDLLSLKDRTRSDGLKFAYIVWPGGGAGGSYNDFDWFDGTLTNGAWLYSFRAQGLTPDMYSIESWMHIPRTTVPESSAYTFMNTALSLITSGFVPTVALVHDQYLYSGYAIWSADGTFFLQYQSDGNLVLYDYTRQWHWATHTDGQTEGYAVMQGDGNFVVYDAGGIARWASGTDGHPGAYLQLDNAGCGLVECYWFLSIYDASNRRIWNSVQFQ